MIIDVHAHLGYWYFPMQNPTAGEISESMKRLGIDRSILSSSPGIVYDFREGNRELAAAIAEFPELYGYVAVNLNYPEESVKEIDSYLLRGKENRFVGIKVHPALCSKSFDCDEALKICEAAARWNVPILIHTFGSPLESPKNVLRAAGLFPEISFILGHFGGFAWEDGIEVGMAAENTYLEICSSCTDMRRVRRAVDAVGKERVLFGTDSTLFMVEYTLGAMDDMGLTEEERTAIMGENAERLFGFSV
jgi:predicted TIM-barrel fold metal-dependent hydrolase